MLRWMIRLAPVALVLLFFVPGAWGVEVAKQLYFSTGDYDPDALDDAVCVFDDLSTLTGPGPWAVNRLVPMNGSRANFGHGIYLWESRNELFVSSVFDNAIVVYATANTMNGTQVPVRKIWGVHTRLVQPHALWIDESRDILYVANSYGGGFRCPGNILVFDDASTISGPAAPSRVIEGMNTMLATPLDLWVDPDSDTLYVANANPEWTPPPPPNPIDPFDPDSLPPGVNVYGSASTANGDVAPSRRIFSTNPLHPLNQDALVHDIHVDPIHDDLYLANQNQWVLVYSPASAVNGNVAPARVLSGFGTVEGLYYVSCTDQLFISDIATVPPSIKVYDAASTRSGPIGGSPDRTITWTPTDKAPSQPLWVTCVSVTGLPGPDPSPEHSSLLDLQPNPFSSEVRIRYTVPLRRRVRVEILDVHGAMVRRLREAVMEPGAHGETWDGTDAQGRFAAAGIYWVLVESGGVRTTKRLTHLR